VVSYTTAINACARAGRWELALQGLADMRPHAVFSSEFASVAYVVFGGRSSSPALPSLGLRQSRISVARALTFVMLQARMLIFNANGRQARFCSSQASLLFSFSFAKLKLRHVGSRKSYRLRHVASQ